MKKVWKKLLSMAVVSALALGLVPPTIARAEAEDWTGEAEVYIGFGGDKAEENDWGFQYNSPENEGNSGDIVATTATAKVGDTVTVSLEFPSEVVNTWWVAPVIVASGIGEMDATVTCKIDDQDVTINSEAGDLWWYEATGDYDETQSVRLAGGWNEWGTQYIDEPSGFKKIEYTITINGAKAAAANAGPASDFEGEADLYIGFGGDKAEENDWGFQYNSPENEGNTADITATNGKLKVGDTATVTLEFASEVVNTWWVAPVLVAEGVSELDATVTCKIDDQEVEIDPSAGDAWWYEATGDYDETQAVRLAGGWNEWGTQYMAEPSGFKKIEYTVTLNSMKVGAATATDADAEATDEPAAAPAGEVDKNGTYNAYIGIQTPKFSFRNAWYDAYGKDDAENPGFFDRITGWDANNEAVELPGTITDTVIAGNGTYEVSITGMEFPEDEFKDQEYMNLIFLDTDIPNTGDITISDMSLSVNGSSVSITPVISPDSPDYLVMLIQNIWNEEVATIGYYPVPVTDMKITFTVSGFDYDNETAVTEAATEAEGATEAEAATEAEVTEAAEGGLGTGAIVGIVAAILAVAGIGAGVVVSKKKKDK
ncbi:MAG: hypothetical protein K6E10_07525 [Eubacterium sp.]|nr:hypothetical protein [Eubacterium sp.]